MSYADPLVIAKSASLDFEFNRTGGDKVSSYWVDTDNASNPVIRLRIVHGVTGKSKTDPNYHVKRHVVTFSRDEFNAAMARHEVMTLNVSLNVPNSGNFSSTEITELAYAARTFLSDPDMVGKLLRGEN